MQLTVDTDADTDVGGMRFILERVSCGDEDVEPMTISVDKDLEDIQLPGGIPEFEDKPLDSNSSHIFADYFVTLDPGCYNVTTQPITQSGEISKDCAPAFAKQIKVKKGKTTEILLINQCKGKGPGAIDVVSALNHPPELISLYFEDSKFVKQCDGQVICATARDPDDDPIEFAWTQVSGPAPWSGPNVVSTVTNNDGSVTQCIEVVPEQPGKYEYTVFVYDLLHHPATGDLIRFEDYYTLIGDPHASHAELTFPFYAANTLLGGGGVNPISEVINLANVDESTQDILRNPVVKDPSTTWAYPYDGTVLPKGILAPELMWNGGSAGDIYYIHLNTSYVDYEIFTAANPPSRFLLDDARWQTLLETGDGGPLTLTVTRLKTGASDASQVVNHTYTIANGYLQGNLYYWSNNLGRVLRIQPGANAPDDFLAAAGHNGCSTCHTVSADGRTMILGGDIDVSTYDLVNDVATFTNSSIGKPVRAWAMPALSPNGKYVVENNGQLPGPPGGSAGIFDSSTGLLIPGTGLDNILLDMPVFSPNGQKLAYVDHQTHGLAVYDFDINGPSVSNQTALVAMGSDPNLDAIAFPSMTPDGKWIVYHRGVYPSSLDTRFGPGSLYMASATTPGVEVRLANVNGDTYPFAAGKRDRNFNYEPTIAPQNAGGYSWIVFTSRRTYGNRATGDSTTVKQLWVAAIDQKPTPGVDPSHPAFWVRGQDPGTLNMRGYWAANGCSPAGLECASNADCCNQNCVDGVCLEACGDGSAPPPPQAGE